MAHRGAQTVTRRRRYERYVLSDYFEREIHQGKEVPEFHSCFAWNHGNRKLAEYVAQYGKKGAMVLVVGKNKTDTWEDKNTAAKRSRTRVEANEVQVFANKTQEGVERPTETTELTPVGSGKAVAETYGIDPDDIPF